jgi:hypothetical protein
VENKQALAIANALKKYGMILADNGSNWYISGETNPTCWNDEDLNILKSIPGSAFEVIVSPPPPGTTLTAPVLNQPANGQSVTSTTPILSWNTVQWATSYEVQLSRHATPDVTIATVLYTSPLQTMPAAALMSGFGYFWRVRAKDTLGRPSAWSAIRSFTIASGATAAPIRNVYKTNDPVLTWNRIPWAQGYTVEITGGSLTQPRLIERTASQLSSTTHLDNGQYSWRMRAKGANNTVGGWSAAEIFVVDG